MIFDKLDGIHQSDKWISISRMIFLAILAAVFMLVLWQGSRMIRISMPDIITLYSFSVTEEMLEDAIIPVFQKNWEEKTGHRAEFVAVYAGSGLITSEILNSMPVQVAILSSEIDALRLSKGGIIQPSSWLQQPNNGVLCTSPVVILVRPGNPERITGFSDLPRKGIRIILPNPITSGVGELAVVCAHNHAVGSERSTAEEFLKAVYDNITASPSNAGDGAELFAAGVGNVLITYEAAALRDLETGRIDGEIVYPDAAVISENLVVGIDKNIPSGNESLVHAFLEFLWTDDIQQILQNYGFRSVSQNVSLPNPPFQEIQHPVFLCDMGGAFRAGSEVVEELWLKHIAGAMRSRLPSDSQDEMGIQEN